MKYRFKVNFTNKIQTHINLFSKHCENYLEKIRIFFNIASRDFVKFNY